MNFSYTSPPGCEADLLFEARLQQHSPVATAALIFLIIINILTFAFTTVLNAMVMIAVQVKSRLTAHKSNILLALLASTGFTVGVIFQPAFIAVLVMFLPDEPSGYCLLKVLRPVLSSLVEASLFHLALISGERYLAMKHPFTYTTMVTEARLLAASALAWLLPIILHVPLAVDKRLFVGITNTFVVPSIVFMVFCHVTVYRETRRHEQQIAAQQVTQEAREQFQKDKKAIKLTSTILAVLVVCFLPLCFISIIALKYRSKISLEAKYVFVSFGVSPVLLLVIQSNYLHGQNETVSCRDY